MKVYTNQTIGIVVFTTMTQSIALFTCSHQNLTASAEIKCHESIIGLDRVWLE